MLVLALVLTVISWSVYTVGLHSVFNWHIWGQSYLPPRLSGILALVGFLGGFLSWCLLIVVTQ